MSMQEESKRKEDDDVGRTAEKFLDLLHLQPITKKSAVFASRELVRQPRRRIRDKVDEL